MLFLEAWNCCVLYLDEIRRRGWKRRETDLSELVIVAIIVVVA